MRLKSFLINLVIVLMMSANMATRGLIKILVFWNKCYGVIIPFDEVTKNFITWFKLYCRWAHVTKVWQLLKCYTSVEKGLKLKVKQFLELISTFVEIAFDIVFSFSKLTGVSRSMRTVRKNIFRRFIKVTKMYIVLLSSF